MNVSDFGLLFACILVLCMFSHYIFYSNHREVQRLQTEYNLCVDQAVEAALYDAVEYDTGTEVFINEKEVINTFFEALFCNFGIMEQPMKQELCKFYIPYILFVEEDGIVPFIQDDSQKEELVSFQSGEKVYFYFEGNEGDQLKVTLHEYVKYDNEEHAVHLEGYFQDVQEQLPEWFRWKSEEFDERKQRLIISLIEECTEECIKNQNQMAEKFGIDYEFQLPVIEYEEWYRTVKDISMIVLFQGYPFGNGVTGTFNRVAIGGARIKKRGLT